MSSDSDDANDSDYSPPSKLRKLKHKQDEEESSANLDETHFVNELEDTIWNFKDGETNVEWVKRVMPYAKPVGKKFMFGQTRTHEYLLASSKCEEKIWVPALIFREARRLGGKEMSSLYRDKGIEYIMPEIGHLKLKYKVDEKDSENFLYVVRTIKQRDIRDCKKSFRASPTKLTLKKKTAEEEPVVHEE